MTYMKKQEVPGAVERCHHQHSCELNGQMTGGQYKEACGLKGLTQKLLSGAAV